MRIFTTALMASAFAFAGLSAARAADAVDQIPEAPVAQEAAPVVNNWGGFYLGGAGTYNMGKFENGRDAKAFGGQIYSGYNWQQDKIVYGVEGDVGYSGADETSNGVTGKHKTNGSIRARVGYDLNPVLLYGTAGVAAAENKASTATDSDSKTHLGYTVGAGAEAFVTNNVTARLEYRYTDYQNKDYSLDGASVSRGYDEHSVKLGIGVKF